MTFDVNLAWDSARGRFVFVLIDDVAGNKNGWYGYSTDSTGSAWVFGNKDGSGTPQPVFSAASFNWDYPSVGVDGSGRVILGAVAFPCSGVCYAVGFHATISTDGEHFSTPVRIGLEQGADSRVVATNNRFEAFVPSYGESDTISRYESSDGINWSNPVAVETFSPPLNDFRLANLDKPIYYAPSLSAAGYTDGRWIVGFQRDAIGFNNIDICTSDRGCGTGNQVADDQFLAGVSASADGYWITYHTYSTLNTRGLPLITQAIYFPTGSAGVGATTNTGIQPSSWVVASKDPSVSGPPPRCSVDCYAGGDFNTPASNRFAASSTPFVNTSSRIDDLFQSFQQDPPQAPNLTFAL